MDAIFMNIYILLLNNSEKLTWTEVINMLLYLMLPLLHMEKYKKVKQKQWI